MAAYVASVSANLETGWAGTQASTSATPIPILPPTGAWPATLWLQTFPEFHPPECSAHITLSRMKQRDKTQSLHGSGLLGSSYPIQVRPSEEGTEYIIPGLPVRPFIRTCWALRFQSSA